MEAVRARGLVRLFGSVTALDGLDLDVARGEIVSVLGPNGAGKSTLLRILGTTVLPDSGTASVCGVDVVGDPTAARRQVGLMIGDERSFYWRLSGRRNLMFFAALHRMRRAEAARRVARLLEVVGLAEAADRPVRGYSSGMRARLSLARALSPSRRAAARRADEGPRPARSHRLPGHCDRTGAGTGRRDPVRDPRSPRGGCDIAADRRTRGRPLRARANHCRLGRGAIGGGLPAAVREHGAGEPVAIGT